MDVTHPPGSTAAAGSLRIGLASAERDHGVIARRYWIQLESGLLVGIVEPSAHHQGFLDAERPRNSTWGLPPGSRGAQARSNSTSSERCSRPVGTC